MFRFFIILAFLFLASTNAYSGTRCDNIPDQSYIKYAEKVTCVEWIVGKKEDNIKCWFSAVILDEHWLITSAHNFIDKDYDYYIFSKDKDKRLKIVEVIRHPKFDPSIVGLGDIALCYVQTPMKIDFYPNLYTEDDELGKQCCFFGYGISGTGSKGITQFDAQMRGGTNMIDAIRGDYLLIADMDAETKNQTALEYCLAGGDSGGGMFINKKLAGINCCVMGKKAPESKYGNESGFVRISKYYKWIEFIIND